MKQRSSIKWIGIEGALMALSPFPLLLPFAGTDIALFPLWRLIVASVASVASVACFICGLMLFRQQLAGKFLAIVAAVGSYAAAFPFIFNNPFAALFLAVPISL